MKNFTVSRPAWVHTRTRMTGSAPPWQSMQRTRWAWCGPVRSVQGTEVKRLNFASCRWQAKQQGLSRSLTIRPANPAPVVTMSPARATAHHPSEMRRTGGARAVLPDGDRDWLGEQDMSGRDARTTSRDDGA